MPKPAPSPTPNDRPAFPAGRALVAILVCLLVWALLFAPTLQHDAQTSRPGTRRSSALAVLRPFVWLNRVVGLRGPARAVDRALGPDESAGTGDAGDVPEPEPLPGGTPTPTSSPSQRPTESPAATATATPTVVPGTTTIRVPSPGHRLHITIVGDSLAAGLGFFAERIFDPNLVNVSRQGRISTGLARPDYFDWDTQMQRIVDALHPDLVIVMLGENDNQPLQSVNGKILTPIGTSAWPPAYEARVRQFAQIATSEGAHLVWVGLPIQADHSRWPLVQRQNDVYRRTIESLPNSAYFDTWQTFANPSGGYTAFLRRDNGSVVQIRETDGLHFTSDGYTILARRVAQMATTLFELAPSTYT